jgi:hypothetical protein
MEMTNGGKPVLFASIPDGPTGAEESTATQTAGPSFVRYKTHMRLFVQMTGTELGQSDTACEIKGHIVATAPGAAPETRIVNATLPQKTNFISENNGLGRLVLDFTKTSINVPSNFTGVLYEEGNQSAGNRFFTNATVDWNTAPSEWADGRWRFFTQTVSNDANFIGHLWFEVLPA